MWQPYVVPRRRLLFAVWLTVLALPVLVIDNIPRTEARAATVHVSGREALAVPAPSSTAPPTTTAPSVAEVTVAAPPTTAGRSTTTATPTTRPVQVTAAAPDAEDPRPAQTASNEEFGGASWYAYNPGECAHRTLPKSTVVTVTRLATGASATCVVTDRGPFGAGRVIDVDRETFAQLADPRAGVIEVRLTW